jgi:transcriptional regulator with XRE-family HTH domain
MMKVDTQARLGRQLAEARKRNFWTQKDVALRVTSPTSHLSLIEQGKANPTVDTLTEMGEALGLSLVFVPKTRLANVLKLIGQPDKPLPLPTEVGSVYEDVFIPDPPDDEEPEHGRR